MAGYWPGMVGVHKQAKKIEGHTSQHDRISLVCTGFIIWHRCFFAQKQPGTPKRARYMGYWPRVRSRWLDIGQVRFWVFMDRDRVKVHKHAKTQRLWICSLLDKSSLVNKLKGFAIWKKKHFFLARHCGYIRAGKAVPFCPSGERIKTQLSFHLARLRSLSDNKGPYCLLSNQSKHMI